MKQIILPKSRSEQFNPNEMTIELLSKLKGTIFQDQFNLVVPHLKHKPFHEGDWYKDISYRTSSVHHYTIVSFNLNVKYQSIEIEIISSSDYDNNFIAFYNDETEQIYCRQTKTEELTVGVNV